MTYQQSIDISDFLEMRNRVPLIDVRAPVEFNEGHVKGAVNVPLFDDQQRAQVGTTYKKQGRHEAIRLGLDFVGPKMRAIVDQVESLLPSDSHQREVLVYCARGGMRSDSVSWLLGQADFRPMRLQGGYKTFRQNCQAVFAKSWDLVVLTGMTGAGKTRLLNQLPVAGEQIIDLERLANHRGSAFGGIGQATQPTTEQFENHLFEELLALDPDRRTWIEDESRSVGKCVVPAPFFDQLHAAPAIQIDVSTAERAEFLIGEYGGLPTDEMVAAIHRISKRLGGQNVNAAVEALEQGNLKKCAEVLLVYYDKTYEICREKNPRLQVLPVDINGCNSEERLARVLEVAGGVVSSP